MSDYSILIDDITGEPSMVLRASDLACIPFDPENTDYQEYLAWVEAGNTAGAI